MTLESCEKCPPSRNYALMARSYFRVFGHCAARDRPAVAANACSRRLRRLWTLHCNFTGDRPDRSRRPADGEANARLELPPRRGSHEGPPPIATLLCAAACTLHSLHPHLCIRLMRRRRGEVSVSEMVVDRPDRPTMAYHLLKRHRTHCLFCTRRRSAVFSRIQNVFERMYRKQ